MCTIISLNVRISGLRRKVYLSSGKSFTMVRTLGLTEAKGARTDCGVVGVGRELCAARVIKRRIKLPTVAEILAIRMVMPPSTVFDEPATETSQALSHFSRYF